MTLSKGRALQSDVNADDRAVEHIGQRLKQFRKQALVTQAQLAERLGIHRSSLSRIEQESDSLVSTVRNYIGALGGSLHINAEFERIIHRAVESNALALDGEAANEGQFVLPIGNEDYYLPRRDVVFSIKPHYADRILEGRKTIELRRRFPIEVPNGTAAIIYTSSPTRALTGVAEIEGVTRQSPETIWRAFAADACITREDFDSYFAGTDHGFAIRLARARPLRRPVELTELRDRFSFAPPQSYLYAKPQMRQALSYEFSELSH